MNKDRRLRCIILGGGGHARVLVDMLMLLDTFSLVGILDANRQRWGDELMGVPVLGGDEQIESIADQVDVFVVGLGGAGDNRPRQKLYTLGREHGLEPVTLIHPRAIVSRWANLGAGCQVLPAAVINANASLGQNVIINSGAIVEHDCVIGDHVHIATGAKLCSAVNVDQAAHIGAGATVRQLIRIGAESLVGAGAVVVTDVPPQARVFGVPARPAG